MAGHSLGTPKTVTRHLTNTHLQPSVQNAIYVSYLYKLTDHKLKAVFSGRGILPSTVEIVPGADNLALKLASVETSNMARASACNIRSGKNRWLLLDACTPDTSKTTHQNHQVRPYEQRRLRRTPHPRHAPGPARIIATCYNTLSFREATGTLFKWYQSHSIPLAR